MKLELITDNQITLVQLNENLKTWYLLLMKSKLTEQQKINEILTKIFSNLIKKKMGKTTRDIITKNPEIKKSVDQVNKAIDDFNTSFRKRVGKEKADQISREVDRLFK